MSVKQYSLQFTVGVFIAAFLAASILVVPFHILCGEEITITSVILSLIFGYFSAFPFLLFLYLPVAYILTKKFFYPAVFVVTATVIATFAGVVVFWALQEPAWMTGVEPSFDLYSVMRPLSAYAATGALTGGLHYLLLKRWKRRELNP